MARVDSNLGEIMSAIDAIVNGFNFTSTTGRSGKRLADKALDTIAERIAERTTARQMDSNQSPLAPNRGEYGEKKRTKGIPIGTGYYPAGNGGQNGIRGGQMLSDLELSGERVIEEKSATMTYGLDGFAKRKAQWFTNGSTGNAGERSGAKNQPPRPFYDLDDGSKRMLDEFFGVELENYVNRIK